jgi:hypothetical protein
MNDFTKEELEDLLYLIDLSEGGELPIYQKILFMLENYCAHTNTKRGMGAVVQLDDCGELI